MRNKLFLIIFILAGYAASAGENLRIFESEQMNSRVLGQKVSYSVLLPDGYAQGEKHYPVVYLLHGLGDDETSWLEYGRITQAVDELVKAGQIEPMIYVMPMGYRTYYVNDYKGEFPYEDMFVNEFVPHIDSVYRTLKNADQRALVGYSMGGFGAFSLHLRHPELFGAAVPLSMSVRTDAQYMSEDANGWNTQWGRLFGGEGMTGEDRITTYYRAHSPFHVFERMTEKRKQAVNLLMFNGDEEETLCRSNEELHILMHRLGVPHNYRVLDGGHSFHVWREALPEALIFINDFMQKLIVKQEALAMVKDEDQNQNTLQLQLAGYGVEVVLPADYHLGNRKYPLILFASFSHEGRLVATKAVHAQVQSNQTPPAVLLFLSSGELQHLDSILPAAGAELRLREGARMRAIAVSGAEAPLAMRQSLEMGFSSCLLFHGCWNNLEELKELLKPGEWKGNDVRVFQIAADRGSDVEGNGNLHILLREQSNRHEYRVHAGNDKDTAAASTLEEALQFILNRFHR